MESAQAEMKYRIVTRIKRVEFRTQAVRSFKKGDDVITERRDLGWFVQFEGSWEALYIGETKPRLETGDTVSITIEKHSLEMQDAQPSQSPV